MPITPETWKVLHADLHIRDWKAALTRFTIQFGERIALN